MKFKHQLAVLMTVAASSAVTPALADCISNAGSTQCSGTDGTSPTPGSGVDGTDATAVTSPTTVVLDNPTGESFSAIGNVGGSSDGQTSNAGDGSDVVAPDQIIIEGTSDTATYSAQLVGGPGGYAGEDGETGLAGEGGGVSKTKAEATGTAQEISIQLQGGFDGGGESGNGGSTQGMEANLNGNFGTVRLVDMGGGADFTENNTGTSGNSGGITAVQEGTAEKLILLTMTGNGRDQGQSGDVHLTVNGTVGEIDAMANCFECGADTAGKVTVVLEDGAVVTGTIENMGGLNGTLVFAMQAASKSDYDTAAASLLQADASGTITINTVNGPRTFTWEGFEDLTNAMTYFAEHHPEVPVDVVITPGGSSGEPTPTVSNTSNPTSSNPTSSEASSPWPTPVKQGLWCSTNRLSAVQQNGVVTLSVQNNGVMVEFGQISGLTYTSNDTFDVQVGVGTNGEVDFANIFAAGDKIGTCKWPVQRYG